MEFERASFRKPFVTFIIENTLRFPRLTNTAIVQFGIVECV